MCKTIEIRDGDKANWKWPETVGELKAIVGADGIVPTVYEQPIENRPLTDEECLCHVDARATAAKAGYACRSGWKDAGYDWIGIYILKSLDLENGPTGPSAGVGF